MSREIEYSSVSAAKFESSGQISAADDAISGYTCIYSAPKDASIRIKPMTVMRNNKSPRWNTQEHFHDDLQLPTEYDAKEGMTILVEAMARECVAVSLSPKPAFRMGNTYEVVLGDNGNTVTTLQRKSSNTERLSVSVPSLVCQEKAWTSYWICLSKAKLYVGVGTVPGQQHIAILDDIARQDQPPADEDVVRYVGFGNTATGDRQAPSPLKVRNIRVTTVPETLQNYLQSLSMDNVEMIRVGSDNDNDETKQLMAEYQAECAKAKARAAKFGVPYQEPKPDAFLPWSQARKLRANPSQGFITGLDLTSQAEKDKQEARRKRFGILEAKDESKQEGDKDEMEVESEGLPIVQAWDNLDLVGKHRVDPPQILWTNPPLDMEEQTNEFAMEPSEPPTLASEKIHIFGIDWAAFKQIRTNDIMSYFSVYGPSYVEWLSDLSANVLFEDKFSAARALEQMSNELPSPPPTEQLGENATIDLGNRGWRLGKTVLRKVANDRYGRRGTTARILMRTATSLDVLHERPTKWPKPPPGFTTKRVLGPGSDFPNRGKKKKQQQKRSRGDDRNEETTGEHPLLSGGLRSSRKGFTIEEMEAERARKKAKTEVEPSSDAQAATADSKED